MDTPPSEQGIFRAQLNRKVMGAWLGATSLSVILEAMALITGVGSFIDWVLLAAFISISSVIGIHIFDKRDVLTVSADGIHDRRVSSRMIRWDDMITHNMQAHATIPALGVWLTEAAEKEAGVYPWSKIYKNQRGPIGKTKGYRIWAHRTHGDGHDFARAVQRFAPNRHG